MLQTQYVSELLNMLHCIAPKITRCGDIIVWQQSSPSAPPEVAGEAPQGYSSAERASTYAAASDVPLSSSQVGSPPQTGHNVQSWVTACKLKKR